MKIFSVYLFIALLTFGHSASAPDKKCGFMSQSACRSLSGLSAGALWPLYWTWTGFDAVRGRS